jgi:hypothetical protein
MSSYVPLPAPFAATSDPEQASLVIRFPNVFVSGKPLAFKNFDS